VAAVHRQVVAIAQQQGWPPPSYARVYDIVRTLDPALLTLAHEGATAYKEAFDLLYRREATQPNDIWQADHTQLDLWVRGDRGQPVRPWLSVILDDYSRAVAGYGLYLPAPTALQTALILRQAIWRKRPSPWRTPRT
jgi:putative transposase